MRPLSRILAFALVSASLSAAVPQLPRITGSVTYRERIALPPGAVVEIRLEDVTRAATVPPVLAQLTIDRIGQVPVRFGLEYDPADINPGGRYAVRATIAQGDNVLFASTETVLVLTQGRGQRADLILSRVGSPRPVEQVSAPPPAPPLPPNPLVDLPATFTGTLSCPDCPGVRYHLNLFGDESFFLRMTYAGRAGAPVDDIGSWALSSDRRVLVLKGRGPDLYRFAVPSSSSLRRLGPDEPPSARSGDELRRMSQFRHVDVRLPMRGAFSYMADAGLFVECSTGQRWPVAMEAANADLERAYSAARPAPGAPVITEVEGLVTERRPMEGSGTRATLVVEKVGQVFPKESCGPRFAGAPLVETRWRLTHLGNAAVPAPSDPRREASLTFDADPMSFTASSGCNRLIGTYTLDNASMTFKSTGTMMACPDAAQAEGVLLKALEATRSFRIAGRTLELMDGSGQRVARFEAHVPTGITVR